MNRSKIRSRGWGFPWCMGYEQETDMEFIHDRLTYLLLSLSTSIHHVLTCSSERDRERERKTAQNDTGAGPGEVGTGTRN
jgi:hypothetical protein